MPLEGIDRQAILESFRRRSNLGPTSTAGIPGGAAALAAPQPTGASQLPSSMSQGPIDQLGKSKPGEAELILKALIQRLRQLPPEGGASVATA